VEDTRVTADEGRLDPEVQAGRALRRLRLARQWSQGETARRMKAYGYDFHQTMIAKIESAQRPLRVRELADFAALYGVEIQELVYPPNGSLTEIDQEIAELETRRDILREQVDENRVYLADAREQMFVAEERYQTFRAEAAVLEGRLAALEDERTKLIGWGTDEKPSAAEAERPPNSRDVVQRDDGTWAVTKPGSERASAVAPTQDAAVQRGAAILHNDGGGELRILGRDGQIRDRRTST
jgi:transcriptional regulator with XRE-family HTH domain